MRDSILKYIRISLIMLGLLTVLTGIIYPCIITALAQIIFPLQANGSMLQHADQLVGSKLIGQNFTSPQYFWGRPSATNPPYNSALSSGSNLGPTNPALLHVVQQRVKTLQQANPDLSSNIPVELVTASASGLDPDISIEAALYQIPRIAKARKMDPNKLQTLVMQKYQGPWFKIFGTARLNVLNLNLEIDALSVEKEK